MSQSDIITHVQDAVRPGEECDIYYSNLQNSVKQSHATIVENRYLLDMNSKSFGSSATLLFNPDEGLDHVVLTLQLPAPGGSLTYNGLALNAGWGYSAVRRIGVRYGNSSLYYFTGDQMLVDALSDCEDSVKKQELFNLGGSALQCAPAGGGAGDFASAVNRTAYVYLKLPHNTPSAQELSLPLPTDLLTAPIQINVEFVSAVELFTQSAYVNNDSQVVLPNEFTIAQAQFKQIHFDDKGEQLARKVNMSEKAYSYPLKYFAQEVFRISDVTGNTQSPVSLTLTGLRSGNCLGIRIWCREQFATTADASGQILVQPNYYTTPSAIQLSVNGLIYFDSRNGQQQLWNLLERKCPATFTTTLTDVNSTSRSFTQVQDTSSWTWIPFGQHSEILANSSELTHGLSLMNSIVNLLIQLPAPVVPGNKFTVTAEYIFNSTLLFSRGGCEYIF